MTTKHLHRTRYAMALLVVGALSSVACSERTRSTIVENPVPAIEAALVVSDSAPPVGGALVVSVQATATDGAVGSYTARITYDPTALRYDSEVSMSDNGLRATNPVPGLVRFAGAAPTGFADGRLASYTFVVLRANSVRTLSLAVDEMHLISRLDAKPALTFSPRRTTAR